MRSWLSALRSSRGQALPLAVAVLAVALPVVLVTLSQVSTMLQREEGEREQRLKVAAAEAAINRVIADLVRGADGVATAYVTTEPHIGGQPFDTYTINTSYTAPSITVNGYTPVVTVSLPAGGQVTPATQQDYVDPGVVHPQLATIPAGYGYLMRLYNVKAGQLQVNWAYSPNGISRVGVWGGMPTEASGAIIPPGQISSWPSQHPILDTGFTPATASFNRTTALTLDPATDDSGGVYTLVFDNSRGVSNKTTAAFAASGGTGDTWVYVKAYKDYLVTATVGSVVVKAYVRQTPGFSEPPAVVTTGTYTFSYTFSASNVAFITSGVYVYTWLSP